LFCELFSRGSLFLFLSAGASSSCAKGEGRTLARARVVLQVRVSCGAGFAERAHGMHRKTWLAWRLLADTISAICFRPVF
jgi:hypothetical protein